MIGRLALVGSLPTPTAQAQSGNLGYRVGVVSESGDVVIWVPGPPTGITILRSPTPAARR